MIYCILKGGLGNMLFQISATMEFSRKNDVDFSFPNLEEHLKYLKNETYYNSKLKCVVHYEKLFSKLKTSKPPPRVPRVSFPFHYVDWDIPKNCIIEGFFQSEKYFKNSRRQILSLFPKTREIDKVSIHVRRGDYLKNPKHHNILDLNFYNKAIELFEEDSFLIFSDDIQWCRNNFTGDRFDFYEGENDLQEMLAMSSCKSNIIANSSFSWWGAWLNMREKSKTVCPSRWVGDGFSHLNTEDIYCQNWIII